MKMIPLFHVTDMGESVRFYTRVLDFGIAPGSSVDNSVVTLLRGDAELMLTRHDGDQVVRVNAHLVVDDVDGLFAFWTRRGLDQSHRRESPVHLGPVEQSWGTREFYVTDPDGNTLRMVQRKA